MPTPTFERYKGDESVTARGRTSAARRETGRYLASRELATAVNAALAAEQPLLLTGEPGTGKTSLAYAVAGELGLGDVLEFSTRSDHQGRDVLYHFDHIRRFYDAQRGVPEASDAKRYRALRPLGEAIASETQRVVLIDEIDKAPRDFPNDLLDAIDKMEFDIPETEERFVYKQRPIVIVTSNVERQLPDPFLRRCVFHNIDFPDAAQLRKILVERLGDSKPLQDLAEAAVKRFVDLRKTWGAELSKQPATGELLVWVRVLLRAGKNAVDVQGGRLADLFPGSLLKTRQDLERVTAGR